MRKNISEVDGRRGSSFKEGEPDQNEVKTPHKDRGENSERKDPEHKTTEPSEATNESKPNGLKRQIANLSLENLLGIFTQRIVLPVTIFSVGALLSYSILSTALNTDAERNSNNLSIVQAISSIEAKQTLENIKNDEILQFASRHYASTGGSNIIPVAYRPKWVPSGFNNEKKLRNKFVNRIAKKGVSNFINNPNTSNPPRGSIQKKEISVLIKKNTQRRGESPHTKSKIWATLTLNPGKKKTLDPI
jgi:hypothetical protein